MARPARPLSVVALLLAGTLLLGACGEDGDTEPADTRRGTALESAYLAGMTHHHESGIAMAAVALERSRDASIERLAGEIASTQKREIAQMKDIHRRLFDAGLEPDPSGHDGLGLSADEAGMTHSAAMNDQLRAAKPFDRAFVDEMVPHHAGALRMSEVLLEHSEDRELRALANAIMRTQRREIAEMSSFRTRRYGAPVPEGARHGGATAPEPMDHGADHSG